MKNNHGFSSLILILIIGSASLLMAKGSAWLGLRELEISENMHYRSKAFYLAEACTADALVRLKRDPLFITDSSTLAFDNCHCSYSLDGAETIRQIVATGVCNNFFSTIKLSVSLSDEITITNWAKE